MTHRDLIIEAARQIAERGDRTLAALLVAVWSADEAREEGDEKGRRLALVSAFQTLAHELGYELGRDVLPAQPQEMGPRTLFITEDGEVVFAPPRFAIEAGSPAGLGHYVVELNMPGGQSVELARLNSPSEAARMRSRILDAIGAQVTSGAATPFVDIRALMAKEVGA